MRSFFHTSLCVKGHGNKYDYGLFHSSSSHNPALQNYKKVSRSRDTRAERGRESDIFFTRADARKQQLAYFPCASVASPGGFYVIGNPAEFPMT